MDLSYLPKRAVALAPFVVVAAVAHILHPKESMRLLSLSGGAADDGETT